MKYGYYLFALSLASCFPSPESAVPNCENGKSIVTYPDKTTECVPNDQKIPNCAVQLRSKRQCEICTIDSNLALVECLECDEKETTKATDNTCVPKIEGCRKHKSDGTCEDCGDRFSSKDKRKCYAKPENCKDSDVEELENSVICKSCDKDYVLQYDRSKGCTTYCALNHAVLQGTHQCMPIPENLRPKIDECASSNRYIAFDKNEDNLGPYNVLLMRTQDISGQFIIECVRDGKSVRCEDQALLAKSIAEQKYVAWDGSLVDNDNRAGAFILYISKKA
ncbi:hypothetical protein O9G_002403 [Rozella allomycis CSF55]|uniref:Uncharacterized protein n=1 Tax=Rozella allomycis (strain CSF55) TaxID=988480 RepID=A0A075AWU1_ROZAC|nr:hypothetical protein O9G_002403 [Rozella allomycis CSF55]|eukprot:EPZ34805.1 hypothetical protein O9G_002403 [Rozella allomycis CSF55]